jgi:hypothetical protein
LTIQLFFAIFLYPAFSTFQMSHIPCF